MDPALERKPDVMMFKAEKISQRVRVQDEASVFR